MSLTRLVLSCVLLCACAQAFLLTSWWSPAAGDADASAAPAVVPLDLVAPRMQTGRLFTAQAMGLLQELQTASDTCLLEAFARMQVQCDVMSADERVRLALVWLGCQRRHTALARIRCADTEPVSMCLGRLDKEDFTQYQQIHLKVLDACAVLSNDVFRAQVQGAVSKLQQAMATAHSFADSTADRFRALDEVAKAGLERQQQADAQALRAALHALESITAAGADMLQRLQVAAQNASASTDDAQQRIQELSVAVDAQAMHIAVALAAEAQRLRGSLQQLDHAVNTSAAHIAARHDQVLQGIDSLVLGQRLLSQLQAAQRDTAAGIATSLAQMRDDSRAVTAVFALFAHATSQALRLVRSLACVAAVALLFEIAGSYSRTRRVWPVRLVVVATTIVELCGAVSTEADLVRTRAALLVAGMLATVFVFIAPAFGKTSTPAEASVIPALIDYIVALRLYGPDTPMPPALVQQLSQPPPAYHCATQKEAVNDVDNDDEGLVAD